jgi:hypothetical protein
MQYGYYAASVSFLGPGGQAEIEFRFGAAGGVPKIPHIPACCPIKWEMGIPANFNTDGEVVKRVR